VVEVAWEFNQMFLGNVEEGVLLHCGVVLRFGPSDSDHTHRISVDQSRILPSFVVRRDGVGGIRADIFVDFVEAAVR